MGVSRWFLNRVVTAFLLFWLTAVQGNADQARLDGLYQELRQPELPNWKMVENEIWGEWSKSGSAAMDLLLQRGRDAIDAGDFDTAIAHLTALTDHAPDFAEGYNARATAYFRSGRYGPALADIRRTLALNPQHFGAMIGLGTIMEDVGRPKLALRAYHAAFAIQPHDPDLKDAIGRLEQQLSGVTL